MKHVTGYDYSRRVSRDCGDKLYSLKIAYDVDIVSAQGANYHCWIPRGMTRQREVEMKEQFKRAARHKGDPVSFSWDYEPEGSVYDR